jgi:hypothetical protein
MLTMLFNLHLFQSIIFEGQGTPDRLPYHYTVEADAMESSSGHTPAVCGVALDCIRPHYLRRLRLRATPRQQPSRPRRPRRRHQHDHQQQQQQQRWPDPEPRSALLRAPRVRLHVLLSRCGTP